MSMPDFAAPDPFLPTRHSLLSRLRDWEDDDSWRDFFDTYWRLIYDVALKAGLNEAEAPDAVQETIISVAKQMPGFRYDRKRGTFKGWLLTITRRRIADQRRKRSGQTPREYVSLDVADAEEGQAVASGVAHDALAEIWQAEWQEHLAKTVVERVKRRVKPDQFQIFEFAVLNGWPVRRVAETLGVTVAQVYLARHRVGALLKKERKLLEERML